jgi:hypothetical protein
VTARTNRQGQATEDDVLAFLAAANAALDRGLCPDYVAALRAQHGPGCPCCAPRGRSEMPPPPLVVVRLSECVRVLRAGAA